MLISYSTSIIFIILLCVLGYAGLFLIDKNKKIKDMMGKMYRSVLVVSMIALPYLIVYGVHQTFPYVYTITQCGSSQTQVLLYPMMADGGVRLKLGNKAYLFNHSDKTLRVATAMYVDPVDGPPKDEYLRDRVKEFVILPHTSERLPVRVLHYIFEKPPEVIEESIQEDDVQYYLQCVQPEA